MDRVDNNIAFAFLKKRGDNQYWDHLAHHQIEMRKVPVSTCSSKYTKEKMAPHHGSHDFSTDQ